jgi:aminoglycoside phosphotransferase (APT) family kinase protein
MTESVGPAAVREAVERVEWPARGDAIDEITKFEDGVNDTFVFSTGLDTPERAVCKFATFSQPDSFQAGVSAARLLAMHTQLPVPELYGFRVTPESVPTFQILDYLPGNSLPGDPGPDNRGVARALGRVIRELGAVPAAGTAGYGWLETDGIETASDLPGPETTVHAEYDSCSEWLLAYGLKLYEDLPAHETLASVARAVPAYLREHSHRFPDDVSQSLVLTDFGPGNLLAPEGCVSREGELSEVTGLLDLERAKFGPMRFNAVNADFLMLRGLDTPGPVREAFYDPLPFGPDVPRRELYLLLAMGREVAALDLFYEEGGEKHNRRGHALAREIERIVG